MNDRQWQQALKRLEFQLEVIERRADRIRAARVGDARVKRYWRSEHWVEGYQVGGHYVLRISDPTPARGRRK